MRVPFALFLNCFFTALVIMTTLVFGGCESDVQVIETLPERRELLPMPLEPTPVVPGVPSQWSCADDTYGNDDGCDCGCGIPDEDCVDQNCDSVHCADGEVASEDDRGLCVPEQVVVPSEWTCAPERFGNDDGCDCGCGVLDEICDQGCATIHCEEGFELAIGSLTDCIAIVVPPPEVPSTWTCDDALYADDICDCGCGTGDLDCAGESCARSHCEEGEEVSPINASQCRTIRLEAPESWTCSAILYARGNGCDCGCGAPDPDCSETSTCIDRCTEGYIVDDNNSANCVVEPPMVPSNWSCNPEAFGDGVCDCGCGAQDTDCALGETCQRDNCGEGLEIHPTIPTQCRAPAPAAPSEWTCAAFTYGTDICDCGCGAPDPDCEGQSQCGRDNCALGSSHQDDDWSLCQDATPTIPRSWSCATSRYDDDICDCGCAAPDFDCMGGVCERDNCSAGQIVNPSQSTQCIDEVPPPPAGWTCAADYYDRDVCDCGCGVADPDCAGGALCVREHCDDDEVVDVSDRTQCVEPPPEVPSTWICNNILFNDSICDCGCGGEDVDCGVGAICDRENCAPGWVVDDEDSTKCEEAEATVPSAWTCSDTKYDDGVCDCGCGVADLDCAGGATCAQNNCTGGQIPDPLDPSQCVQAPPQVPATWTCADSAYNDGVCDCGCGAPDLDCSGGATCAQNNCSGGQIPEQTDPSQCVEPPPQVPATWTCADSAYNNGVCDCGCGAPDLDCANSASCTQEHCPSGHIVDPAQWELCIVDDPGVPAAWSCNENYYGTNDGCDCGCDVVDPDCGVPATCDYTYCTAPEVVSELDSSQCVPPRTDTLFSGYLVQNVQSTTNVQTATLPDLWLNPGDVVLIARNASQADFEAHWNVSLGTNVHFINQEQSGSTGVPIINGDEVFRLVNGQGEIVDGPVGPGEALHAYFQRDTGWFFWSEESATPGTTELTTGAGLQLSEWSDGNGDFAMEYVELTFIEN